MDIKYPVFSKNRGYFTLIILYIDFCPVFETKLLKKYLFLHKNFLYTHKNLYMDLLFNGLQILSIFYLQCNKNMFQSY